MRLNFQLIGDRLPHVLYGGDYNEVERQEGLKRMFPPPITPDELQPDILLVSHGHLDHFDEPTIKSFGSAGRTLLAAPPSCISRAHGPRKFGLKTFA